MRTFFIFTLLLVVSIRLHAQHCLLKKAYFQSFKADTKSLKNACIHPSEKAVISTWITFCATLLCTQLDQEIKIQVQQNRSRTSNQVSKFIEPFGRGYTTFGISAGLCCWGVINHNTAVQETGLTAIKCLLFTDLITGFTKFAVQRKRPYATDNPGAIYGFWQTQSNFSFPSGHAADAFALATVLCHRIKKPSWRMPIYGMAAAVALSRIHDNKHWASDVVIGSLVGFTTAKIILHADNWKPHAKNELPFTP